MPPHPLSPGPRFHGGLFSHGTLILQTHNARPIPPGYGTMERDGRPTPTSLPLHDHPHPKIETKVFGSCLRSELNDTVGKPQTGCRAPCPRRLEVGARGLWPPVCLRRQPQSGKTMSPKGDMRRNAPRPEFIRRAREGSRKTYRSKPTGSFSLGREEAKNPVFENNFR